MSDNIPVKWTDPQIRAIVRDELVKVEAEKTVMAVAEMAVFKENIKQSLETHMEDMGIPEDMRVDMRALAEKLIG